VLQTDPDKARAIARLTTYRYLRLPNYTTNLLRLGFSESEFANGGSDRLVDAIVAWGDPGSIMQCVREHHAAGADHVCIQVLTDPPQDFAGILAGWRTCARAFPRSARRPTERPQSRGRARVSRCARPEVMLCLAGGCSPAGSVTRTG